jgi:FkbM family methyltransferase
MLTVERYNVKLYFDDDGFAELPYVYGPLTTGRVYEEKFLQHVRSLGLRGEYVDVGAHLGTHTVWFAALCPATHVHAFEPVARFAGMVRRNITANGLESRVTVHQVGLSDRAGRATNRLSREHQVGFMPDADAADESFDIVRLDKVIGRRPVAVIKLDVEGMEAAALRGAKRILSKWRPVVYAEAHSPDAADEIQQVLAPYGYRPTGQVFNASPTYEFAAPPRQRLDALRPLWRRLPVPLRRRLSRRARGWLTRSAALDGRTRTR